MKTLTYIACLVSFPVVCLAGVIDATSLETLSKSLKEAQKGEPKEDVAVTDKLVCDAAHGLDPKDPKDLEVILERLRARLHGKSVGAVALEVRMQQEAASDQKRRKAEEFVRERREKWKERRAGVPSIVTGIARDQVLKLLGEPDKKSDSATVENWLYRYDAAHNEEQIWIDVVVVQITDGTVSKVMPLPERRHIEDMADPAKANAKEPQKPTPDATSK